MISHTELFLIDLYVPNQDILSILNLRLSEGLGSGGGVFREELQEEAHKQTTDHKQ